MNPENPHDWFLKAERDLGLAHHAHKQGLDYPDLICYHCQQAAEKFLKAIVIYKGIPLRKTHDLEVLLDILAPAELSVGVEFYEHARKINDYGVMIRYPDPSGDPTEADVAEALITAAFFRTFAAGALGYETSRS